MNLAGQKRAAPGHVVLRVIEYQVDGGEVIRLLTDLLDPQAYPAAELAALYRERWVRHEALCNRVGVRDPHCQPVAAG
jgi:hypothetical protein